MTSGRVPFNYYLLTGLTGLAISLLFLSTIRELLLIFGIHSVSLVTVLIAAIICMCIGSAISGRLSERISRPLVYFVSFTLVIAVFAFAHKAVFEKLIVLLETHNTGHHPAFGAGLIRLAFSFAYLLIPFSLMAALLPMLFRQFIKSIHHSGIFMSATLISLAFATLVSVILTVMFLVPAFGFNSLFIAAIIVLLILAATGILLIFRKRPLKTGSAISAPAPAKSGLRFRKKRTVLEMSGKLTRAMLRGSVFHAFSFSAMLIIDFRILIKYNYTTPVMFYAVVLVVILSGIIAGSLLYKRTVDRPANKFLTLATLQVVAGFAALICYALFHLVASGFMSGLTKNQSLYHVIIRQSALFAVLLFVPSAIYGISFPLAGRLYPKRIQHTGKNFAKLTCLVFLSVMAALVITPFVLIPIAGIEISFILLSVVVLLSGIYLIFRDSRLIRGFRIGYGFSMLLLFAVIAAFLYILDLRHQHRNTGPTMEGSTASVSLIEQYGSKQLYLNNEYYFGTDAAGLKEQVLAAAIPLLVRPHMDSVLVIGFGTGITASILDQNGISSLLISELFPEIVRMSSYAFADENSDILTGPRTDIAIEDARSFLFRTTRKFDLITMGSDQISMFPGRYSTEFYKLCKSRLTDSGVLCQILPLMHDETEFKSVLKTTSSEFAYNTLWYVSPYKMLLVSSKRQDEIDYCRFEETFNTLNRNKQISVTGIGDPLEMAGHLILSGGAIDELTKGFANVTDNRPFTGSGNSADNNAVIRNIESLAGYGKGFYFPESCQPDSSVILNRMKQMNQSLLKNAGQTSLEHQRLVGFYEVNGLLLQQYL